jgi:protein-tyrosine-phosphatase
MAEAIMRSRMPRSWLAAVEVSSAGTASRDGMPAAPGAVAVLAERGIDLSRHRAQSLTAEMIEASDIIVVMENAHRDEIEELAPGAAQRVIIFGELEPGRGDPEVADPIGGDEGVYRGTRDELERLVGLLIDYLEVEFGLSH